MLNHPFFHLPNLDLCSSADKECSYHLWKMPAKQQFSFSCVARVLFFIYLNKLLQFCKLGGNLRNESVITNDVQVSNLIWLKQWGKRQAKDGSQDLISAAHVFERKNILKNIFEMLERYY